MTPSDPIDYGIIGAIDGDYPGCIERAYRNLPEGFGETFAEYVDTRISGAWYEYPMENAEEMKRALERAGYEVRVMTDVP